MESRTDKELREIAKGVTEGTILFDTQVPEDLLPMVFMPLIFMDENQIEFLRGKHIYGELGHTFPQGINGYPMFTVIFAISKEEKRKVEQYIKELKAWTEGASK